MAPPEPSLFFSAAQKGSLQAVVDAFLPPLPVPVLDSKEAVKRYWEYRLSQDPAFLAALDESLQQWSTADRRRLQRLLTMLSTNIGTFILFGKLSWRAFPQWSLPERSDVLQYLQLSSVPQRVRLFHLLKQHICSLAYSFTIAGKNPFWEGMNYPGPAQDTHGRLPPPPPPPSFLAVGNATALNCDVLVVGAGAGGCVVASILSRAGYQVLLVEQGTLVSSQGPEITQLPADARDYRWHEPSGQVVITTTHGPMTIHVGSTLGGALTASWSGCLPLPEHVRVEWATTFGWDAFGNGGEYDRALKYVMKRVIGNDTYPVNFNPMNQKLMEGCEAMHYKWQTIVPSLKHTPEDAIAGYLGWGNQHGIKNTAVSVFLRDAVRHGGQVLTGARVNKIIKSSAAHSLHGKRPSTVGAECKITNSHGEERTLTIFAKRSVIVTAGALHTPCLLQQSGFSNTHIGRHLCLHPSTTVLGFMKEEDTLDSFSDAPVTTSCHEFELGPTGDGYGARIECASAHPGGMASCLVWTTPWQFKDRLRRLSHAVPLVVCQRDSGQGSVRLAPDGSLQVEYNSNKHDQESMATAVVAALNILVTNGATEICASGMRDPGLQLFTGPYSVHRMASDVVLQNYLSSVYRQALDEHEVALFSTHQMGSCRMSTSAATGAVDVNGELWECDNLFVMDASTFPTASGVNPILTVLVLAKMLSSRLAMRLRYEDRRSSSRMEAQRAEELNSQREQLRAVRENNQNGHALRTFLRRWLPLLLLWVILLVLFVPMISGELMKFIASLQSGQSSSIASAPADTNTEEPIADKWDATGESLTRFLDPNSLIWSVLFIPLLFAAR